MNPTQRLAYPMLRLVNCLLAFGLGLLWSNLPTAAASDPPLNFSQDIRPLLSDRCFACHGPDEETRESDLRVDDLESLLEDRGGYRVLDRQDPLASELLQRVTSDDPDLRMPPPGSTKPLTAEEIAKVQAWIEAGGAWQQHWAYKVPRSTPTPELPETDRPDQVWPSENWIDNYIFARLQTAGTIPAPRADAITLARRLAFDLTGLPPDEQTLQDFVQAGTPQAYTRLVDQLLSSPEFGERLAMYWLDLVRFADTVGYHGDQDHSISPYRDYVIDAFNDDKPFDQFTLEQLAGDLLDEPTEEQIIATGYNRLLQTSHEGGVQPKEYLAIYAADRVRNFSAVWMGATVGCAQCHDHKFDPYAARDFYALAAFFADVDEAQHFKLGSNALPTRRPPEREVLDRATRVLITGYQRQLDGLASRLESLESQATTSADGPPSPAAADVRQQMEQLQQQIEAASQSARLTMITVATQPRPVRLLPRGNWLDDSGEILEPSLPEFLVPDATYQAASDAAQRMDRRDLAHWLTDRQHGIGLLTARVFVNRLWMLLFGSGLSRSVEDFGGQGEPPTHPELLDRLAIEFVDSGWDIKHMVRLITGSYTYQQSSLESPSQRALDPLNRLYGRQNRFRIDAEMVRDTALACGGLLVRQVGGASVKPYQPSGYYRHLNFPVRTYQASTDAGQWRRGVYVHWQRQFLHPMLRAFDAPTREECTAQRPRSNTPLAALVWLNDPSFVEAARGLAQRVLRSSVDDDAERLATCFRLATSREATAAELELLQQLLDAARDEYAESAAAEELLSVGQFQAPPPAEAGDVAAWATVARAVLNLNETYTRN